MSAGARYARGHLDAMTEWIDTVLGREGRDLQYLIEDLREQLGALAEELGAAERDESTPLALPTVTQVGSRNFTAGGWLR